ncbi:histidine kinase N-terminal domain-containing protein [Melioribacteraceae bacterium 4301-Me]|uniref:histidine kinase N-terminal domain-containing protein n=1 Tax=Pyranulibacter aquaticus TaxID=3163344 RepID=UPI003599C9CF
MDFSKIISFLEANIPTLARAYYEQVQKSDFMLTYRKLDEPKIILREEAVFKNMIEWLKTGASNDKAEQFFEKIGRERFNERFPLTEINYALYITKKVFWSFVAWKPELFPNTDFQTMVEQMTVLGNFFDLGSFYIVRSYLNELFNKIDEASKLTKEDMKKLLVKGEFDKDNLDKSEIVWRNI